MFFTEICHPSSEWLLARAEEIARGVFADPG